MSRRSTLPTIVSIIFATLALAALAQPAPPGTPVKTGKATFSYSGTALSFEDVSGPFNQSVSQRDRRSRSRSGSLCSWSRHRGTACGEPRGGLLPVRPLAR